MTAILRRLTSKCSSLEETSNTIIMINVDIMNSIDIGKRLTEYVGEIAALVETRRLMDEMREMSANECFDTNTQV